MNKSNNFTPSTMLYFRYKLDIAQSLSIIKEWLENNPQKSEDDLSQLIRSGSVIFKNEKLYSLPKLSRSQADVLAREIKGAEGVEIKNRLYHLTPYKQCFVGSELVDWLIDHKQVVKEEAIALGQDLLEHDIISHVCNDHDFKNDFLFYRFNQ